MDACKKIIEELLDMKHCHYAWPFYMPLNAENLGLTDYHDKIKKPMDLGSIKNKLENGHYSSVLEFAEDVRLVFSNCFKYFDPDNDYVGMAQELRNVFEMLYAQIPKEPVPNVPAHNTHIQGNMQGLSGKPLAFLKLTLSSNSEFDSDTDQDADPDTDSDSEDLAVKLKVAKFKLDMTFSKLRDLMEKDRQVKEMKKDIEKERVILEKVVQDLTEEILAVKAAFKKEKNVKVPAPISSLSSLDQARNASTTVPAGLSSLDQARNASTAVAATRSAASKAKRGRGRPRGKRN
ncbi:bromodomain-containing protein 3-like [Drosophila madeirensis]|uniref:Bromodomain-containing protein 3-like n=1 Tax=Drosophila madeirensis TaxID=30013 RepID=A0AAU9FZ58_DROMD